MKAQVFERQKKSRGSSSHQCVGPDVYVAVVTRPDNLDPLPEGTQLNEDRLNRRGYRVIYVGEGYRRSSGPRSALGRARAKAQEIAAGLDDRGATPDTGEEGR